MKRQQLPLYLLLIALLTGVCFSCMDEQLLSTTYGDGGSNNVPDKSMQLSVKVPSAAEAGEGEMDGTPYEDRVDTIDVLVFDPAPSGGEQYLRMASTGIKVAGKAHTFEVTMPIGKDFEVHVFANCHSELVRRGAFRSPKAEKNTLLNRLTYHTVRQMNLRKLLLPMHGCTTGVEISSTTTDVLKVEVLRSVASVAVMTNGSIDPLGKLTGGTLDNFKFHSLFVFFPTDSAQIAPYKDTQYVGEDEPYAGNVLTPSVPAEILAAGAELDFDSVLVRKSSNVAVGLLDGLYFYENKVWGQTESDDNNTRIVVGGLFKNDTDTTYYRINLWKGKDDTFFPVLRNHKYIFNIGSVSDSGYDTPEEAARGKAINLEVTLIDWVDEFQDIDYSGQHYFKTSTKEIRLSRNAQSKRVLTVESDVPADEWTWYFAEKTNGATTPPTWYKKKDTDIDSIAPTKSLTLENSRFKVARAQIMGEPVEGKPNPTNRATLTVTALKAYSDKPGTLPSPNDESYKNILVIKIKNLTVYFDLEQLNKSQDDWGNGGDLDTGLGEKD